MNDTNIFIPSYHRPDNIKTAKWFVRQGWQPDKITVFVDDATDDIGEYRKSCTEMGVNLVVFDMDEARRRYDYVHRPSKSRRSAGQARNMFFDYAGSKGIDFWMVQDDDTEGYERKSHGRYRGMVGADEVRRVFEAVETMMRKRHIGVWGISQTGDFIGGENKKALRWKVMNTTFYLRPYIYRGERGVQDDDTSLFCGVYNEGLLTGSIGDGIILKQTPSVTAPGGLTDLYNECRLMNKALVVPIQFPSAVSAEKQLMNGGRLHHRINLRYLCPKLMRVERGNNLAWDTYPEDYPFTNEPKRP